jgi:hypothetical protein
MVEALVSMTDSITDLPAAFKTAIQMLALWTSSPNIVCAHKGSPLSGNLSSFENSEATTPGAPFHNALQKIF